MSERTRIQQRACPECGHEQVDLALNEEELERADVLECVCSECGCEFEKEIESRMDSSTETEFPEVE